MIPIQFSGDGWCLLCKAENHTIQQLIYRDSKKWLKCSLTSLAENNLATIRIGDCVGE